MITDATAVRVATVGLLSGGAKVGRLLHFAPRDPDLILEIEGGDGRLAKVQVPAEQICYVAFHRTPLSRRAQVERDAVVRKIHMPGGRAIVVEAAEPAFKARIGFYAIPRDPASRFEIIFFYRHGVNKIENTALLGVMLIENGAVAPGDLARGLAEQVARRSVPVGQILMDQNKILPADVASALARQKRGEGKLGEILVQEGAATRADVDSALVEQQRRSVARLGAVLSEMNVVSERDLASTLAQKFGIPFIDLDACAVHPEVRLRLSPKVIMRLRALPIDEDPRSLTVAVSDPLEAAAIDELRARTRKQIREVVVTPSQLRAHIEGLGVPPAKESVVANIAAPQPPAPPAHEAPPDADVVIELATQVVSAAYAAGARRIVLEPTGAHHAEIRFRVGDAFVCYREIPANHVAPLAARLEVMTHVRNSDRAEKRDAPLSAPSPRL